MGEVTAELEQECFFIAPIGAEGSEARQRSDDVLQYIVVRAAAELGLQAIRADQIGVPGQINLQVLRHVLSAKAVVADLTGRNPNVFYELAVRHTAQLPVVLIAEEDERDNLPFDIANMRTIFFDHKSLASADRCRQEIVKQLREALAGPVDSPIASALSLEALQRGSPTEQILGDLVARVDELAWGQARVLEALAYIRMETYSTHLTPGEVQRRAHRDEGRRPVLPHDLTVIESGPWAGHAIHSPTGTVWQAMADGGYRRVPVRLDDIGTMLAEVARDMRHAFRLEDGVQLPKESVTQRGDQSLEGLNEE